jgi:hypothetical protein
MKLSLIELIKDFINSACCRWMNKSNDYYYLKNFMAMLLAPIVFKRMEKQSILCFNKLALINFLNSHSKLNSIAQIFI